MWEDINGELLSGLLASLCPYTFCADMSALVSRMMSMGHVQALCKKISQVWEGEDNKDFWCQQSKLFLAGSFTFDLAKEKLTSHGLSLDDWSVSVMTLACFAASLNDKKAFWTALSQYRYTVPYVTVYCENSFSPVNVLDVWQKLMGPLLLSKKHKDFHSIIWQQAFDLSTMISRLMFVSQCHLNDHKGSISPLYILVDYLSYRNNYTLLIAPMLVDQIDRDLLECPDNSFYALDICRKMAIAFSRMWNTSQNNRLDALVYVNQAARRFESSTISFSNEDKVNSIMPIAIDLMIVLGRFHQLRNNVSHAAVIQWAIMRGRLAYITASQNPQQKCCFLKSALIQYDATSVLSRFSTDFRHVWSYQTEQMRQITSYVYAASEFFNNIANLTPAVASNCLNALTGLYPLLTPYDVLINRSDFGAYARAQHCYAARFLSSLVILQAKYRRDFAPWSLANQEVKMRLNLCSHPMHTPCNQLRDLYPVVLLNSVAQQAQSFRKKVQLRCDALDKSWFAFKSKPTLAHMSLVFEVLGNLMNAIRYVSSETMPNVLKDVLGNADRYLNKVHEMMLKELDLLLTYDDLKELISIVGFSRYLHNYCMIMLNYKLCQKKPPDFTFLSRLVEFTQSTHHAAKEGLLKNLINVSIIYLSDALNEDTIAGSQSGFSHMFLTDSSEPAHKAHEWSLELERPDYRMLTSYEFLVVAIMRCLNDTNISLLNRFDCVLIRDWNVKLRIMEHIRDIRSAYSVPIGSQFELMSRDRPDLLKRPINSSVLLYMQNLLLSLWSQSVFSRKTLNIDHVFMQLHMPIDSSYCRNFDLLDAMPSLFSRKTGETNIAIHELYMSFDKTVKEGVNDWSQYSRETLQLLCLRENAGDIIGQRKKMHKHEKKPGHLVSTGLELFYSLRLTSEDRADEKNPNSILWNLELARYLSGEIGHKKKVAVSCLDSLKNYFHFIYWSDKYNSIVGQLESFAEIKQKYARFMSLDDDLMPIVGSFCDFKEANPMVAAIMGDVLLNRCILAFCESQIMEQYKRTESLDRVTNLLKRNKWYLKFSRKVIFLYRYLLLLIARELEQCLVNESFEYLSTEIDVCDSISMDGRINICGIRGAIIEIVKTPRDLGKLYAGEMFSNENVTLSHFDEFSSGKYNSDGVSDELVSMLIAHQLSLEFARSFVNLLHSSLHGKHQEASYSLLCSVENVESIRLALSKTDRHKEFFHIVRQSQQSPNIDLFASRPTHQDQCGVIQRQGGGYDPFNQSAIIRGVRVGLNDVHYIADRLIHLQEAAHSLHKVICFENLVFLIQVRSFQTLISQGVLGKFPIFNDAVQEDRSDFLREMMQGRYSKSSPLDLGGSDSQVNAFRRTMQEKVQEIHLFSVRRYLLERWEERGMGPLFLDAIETMYMKLFDVCHLLSMKNDTGKCRYLIDCRFSSAMHDLLSIYSEVIEVLSCIDVKTSKLPYDVSHIFIEQLPEIKKSSLLELINTLFSGENNYAAKISIVDRSPKAFRVARNKLPHDITVLFENFEINDQVFRLETRSGYYLMTNQCQLFVRLIERGWCKETIISSTDLVNYVDQLFWDFCGLKGAFYQCDPSARCHQFMLIFYAMVISHEMSFCDNTLDMSQNSVSMDTIIILTKAWQYMTLHFKAGAWVDKFKGAFLQKVKPRFIGSWGVGKLFDCAHFKSVVEARELFNKYIEKKVNDSFRESITNKDPYLVFVRTYYRQLVQEKTEFDVSFELCSDDPLISSVSMSRYTYHAMRLVLGIYGNNIPNNKRAVGYLPRISVHAIDAQINAVSCTSISCYFDDSSKIVKEEEWTDEDIISFRLRAKRAFKLLDVTISRLEIELYSIPAERSVQLRVLRDIISIIKSFLMRSSCYSEDVFCSLDKYVSNELICRIGHNKLKQLTRLGLIDLSSQSHDVLTFAEAKKRFSVLLQCEINIYSAKFIDEVRSVNMSPLNSSDVIFQWMYMFYYQQALKDENSALLNELRAWPISISFDGQVIKMPLDERISKCKYIVKMAMRPSIDAQIVEHDRQRCSADVMIIDILAEMIYSMRYWDHKNLLLDLRDFGDQVTVLDFLDTHQISQKRKIFIVPYMADRFPFDDYIIVDARTSSRISCHCMSNVDSTLIQALEAAYQDAEKDHKVYQRIDQNDGPVDWLRKVLSDLVRVDSKSTSYVRYQRFTGLSVHVPSCFNVRIIEDWYYFTHVNEVLGSMLEAKSVHPYESFGGNIVINDDFRGFLFTEGCLVDCSDRTKTSGPYPLIIHVMSDVNNMMRYFDAYCTQSADTSDICARIHAAFAEKLSIAALQERHQIIRLDKTTVNNNSNINRYYMGSDHALLQKGDNLLGFEQDLVCRGKSRIPSSRSLKLRVYSPDMQLRPGSPLAGGQPMHTMRGEGSSFNQAIDLKDEFYRASDGLLVDLMQSRLSMSSGFCVGEHLSAVTVAMTRGMIMSSERSLSQRYEDNNFVISGRFTLMQIEHFNMDYIVKDIEDAIFAAKDRSGFSNVCSFSVDTCSCMIHVNVVYKRMPSLLMPRRIDDEVLDISVKAILASCLQNDEKEDFSFVDVGLLSHTINGQLDTLIKAMPTCRGSYYLSLSIGTIIDHDGFNKTYTLEYKGDNVQDAKSFFFKEVMLSYLSCIRLSLLYLGCTVPKFETYNGLVIWLREAFSQTSVAPISSEDVNYIAVFEKTALLHIAKMLDPWASITTQSQLSFQKLVTQSLMLTASVCMIKCNADSEKWIKVPAYNSKDLASMILAYLQWYLSLIRHDAVAFECGDSKELNEFMLQDNSREINEFCMSIDPHESGITLLDPPARSHCCPEKVKRGIVPLVNEFGIFSREKGDVYSFEPLRNMLMRYF